jgi:hypothetical protein
MHSGLSCHVSHRRPLGDEVMTIEFEPSIWPFDSRLWKFAKRWWKVSYDNGMIGCSWIHHRPLAAGQFMIVRHLGSEKCGRRSGISARSQEVKQKEIAPLHRRELARKLHVQCTEFGPDFEWFTSISFHYHAVTFHNLLTSPVTSIKGCKIGCTLSDNLNSWPIARGGSRW